MIVITDVGPIVTSITFENKKICQKRDEREVLATSKLLFKLCLGPLNQ